MTPVRAPDVVRGDVPGLLCRGMPVLDSDDYGSVYEYSQDNPASSYWTIDWSGRAAIYLSLAWLADQGHACLINRETWKHV